MQGGTQCVGEAVCTRETFQTVEQRPQVREIVRHVREHRPFEKEFVNEVRPCSQVFRLPFSCAVAFLCLLPCAIHHSCDAIVLRHKALHVSYKRPAVLATTLCICSPLQQ
jgi:hypothetical protein